MDSGGGWCCHLATVARSSPSLRAMAASDMPSSPRTWICFHCCIVINPWFLRCDVCWVASEPMTAAAASTNAGFLAIPLYECWVLNDPSADFLAITSAEVLTIRDMRVAFISRRSATTRGHASKVWLRQNLGHPRQMCAIARDSIMVRTMFGRT